MKRIISFAIILLALFALTACGSGGQDAKEESAAAPAASYAEETAPSDEIKPKEAPSEQAHPSEQSAPTTEQAEKPAAQAQPTESQSGDVKLKVQAGDSVFTATLADNSSVDALKELMADGPLTLHMSDYANMEKGADLGVDLPENNEPMDTRAGDIILYQGRTLAIYYDTNNWSLTPIGKIDDVDEEELRAALGDGDVTVTFSLV